MATVTESINVRILQLLGLEDTFDLDYDTYTQLLKERLIRVTVSNDKISDKDFNLLRAELKRVKVKPKNKQFKIEQEKLLNKKKRPSTAKISITKLLPPQKGGTLSIYRQVQKKSSELQYSKEEQTEKKDPKNLLSKIDEKLSSILESLLAISKSENKSFEINRRERERKKREEKENLLEKGGKLIGGAVQKIIAPFQNIFERIWRFIKFTLLGRAFTMLMNWLGDPKNKKKVETLGRFLKDWWPALLFGVVAFTNPFGKLVRSVLGTVIKWTFRVSKFVIPKLLNIVKSPAGIGIGLFTAGAWVPQLFPQTVNEQERKTDKAPGSKEDKIKALEQQKANLNLFEKLQGKGSEIDEQIEYLKTGKTKSYGFYSGGFVSGETGVDKVPAMLSDGEFVMSRGAVQKFGIPFLESLNAAGGGTNKPKVIRGVPHAYGGGPIGGKYSSSGNNDIENIKKFIKHKIGYDVDKPETWGSAFSSGISGILGGSKFPGGSSRPGKGFDFQSVASQVYGYAKKKIPTQKEILQTGANFANRTKDFVGDLNPFSSLGRGLSSFADKPLFGETAAIERERKLGLMKPGADSLTEESKKKLASRDAYVKSLYDPKKDKGISGFFKKRFQKIQNRGLIPDLFSPLKEEGTEKFVEKISGGRVKNLGAKITGLQFAAKGLLGPLGRPFQIDDRGSLGRYLRPAMMEAQGRGHGSVGAKALGQGTYNRLVGDKIANLALGQTGFTVDKSGRAKTQDVFDSNKTAEQYFKETRQAIKALGNVLQGKEASIGEGKNIEKLSGLSGGAKAAYEAAFKGLSGILRINQNNGWGNLRPMGNDIDLGGGFRPTDSKGKPISQQEMEKRRKAETLKRFGPSVNLYNKPQANTGQPYKSRFARPTRGKTGSVKKPGGWNPFGWFTQRRQGGGLIGESTGLDYSMSASDRQILPINGMNMTAALEPGEYVLPKGFVQKIGAHNIDRAVGEHDRDSTAAKLGYREIKTPKITPYSSSGKSKTIMLPPTVSSSKNYNRSISGSGSEVPDFSPIPAQGIETRMMAASIYGLVT